MRAHAAMPQSGEDPRFSSRNAVGTPPGKTTPGASMVAAATNGTETPGSANFSFGLPVVSSPGRGLNIDLSLFYNSRIWTGDSTSMSYNMDQGWPAPGFRLGYGQLTRFCSYCGFNLVDGNGTRHEISSNGYNVYDSKDGTFIHLNTSPMTAIYPDGAQVSYGEHAPAAPVQRFVRRHGRVQVPTVMRSSIRFRAVGFFGATLIYICVGFHPTSMLPRNSYAPALMSLKQKPPSGFVLQAAMRR